MLPHFVGYDLFRYNGATQEKAYLEKRKEGSVIKFVPPDQVPEGAVTGPADIGCDYYGRHLLYFAGTSAFSLCKAKGKDGGGYLVSCANSSCLELKGLRETEVGGEAIECILTVLCE